MSDNLAIDCYPYRVTVTPYNSKQAKARAARGTNKRPLKQPFAYTFATLNDALTYMFDHSHNTIMLLHSGLWHTFIDEAHNHYILRLNHDVATQGSFTDRMAGLSDEYKQYVAVSIDAIKRSPYCY